MSITISRRPGPIRLALALAMLLAATVGVPALAAPDVDFDTVIAQARERAQAEHRPSAAPVPRWLRELPYAQWREIRFQRSRALWRDTDSPVQVRLYPPGSIYQSSPRLHVVEDGQVRTLTFDPDDFFYGSGISKGSMPEGMGYAGFILEPGAGRSEDDGALRVLGATFLNGMPTGIAGATARLLAVDTGLPSGEEYPAFTDFWLVRPPAGAAHTQLYAIAESPRLTAAYALQVSLGDPVQVAVSARLFLREVPRKLVPLALTAGFLRGESSPPADALYPQVHDAGGLAWQHGAEAHWRLLHNPPRLSLDTVLDHTPDRFGLLQRERDFSRYQSLEGRFEARPSLFATLPAAMPGAMPGALELLQLPVNDPFNQNAIALWHLPAANLSAGAAPIALDYALTWCVTACPGPKAAQVSTTRIDLPANGGPLIAEVDFDRGELPAEPLPQPQVELAGGELQGAEVHPLPGHGWRLRLRARPAGNAPLKITAQLLRDGTPLGERWHYVSPTGD